MHTLHISVRVSDAPLTTQFCAIIRGKAAEDAQVLAALPPTWEIPMEFQTLVFSLVFSPPLALAVIYGVSQ